MAPLLVLLAVFLGALLAQRALRGRWSPAAAGRLAAAAMFVFTGASHFVFTAEMVEMVPPVFPRPLFWIYLTGILEILGAIGLLLERTRRAAAWGLALLLLAPFPSNVYAAMEGVGMGRHVEGPSYLWARGALQAVFLAWVVWFGLVIDRRSRGGPG